MSPGLLNPFRFGTPGAGAYATEVLSDAPIVYYRLGDAQPVVGSTVMADSSGNARDGAFTSVSSTFPVLGRPSSLTGDTDTAMQLAGNGYAQGPAVASWIQPAALTAKLRVKPASVAVTRELLNRGTSGSFGAAQSWRIVQINQTVFLRMFVNGTSTTTTITTGNVLSTSSWTEIAYTFASNTARLYINGTSAGTSSITGSLSPGTQNLRLGYDAQANTTWSGEMDEVALYDYELPALRLAAHYAAA